MTEVVALIKSEPRARLFFAALAQSSLGNGVAYPALLIVAYARLHSPWAISLVLLADFVPSMLLGPVLGAVVDRWSRLGCAAIADMVRAAAFVGIAAVGSFEATLLLALLAGMGKALFRPAALAGIPTMVGSERSSAATSLYGAISDFGYLAGGPALAAAAFAVVGPEELLAANGATFAISALVLARLAIGHSGAATGSDREASDSLLKQAREGLRATLRMPGIRVVVFAFSAGMFFGGVFNVIELPFAKEALGAGGSGYSVLVAFYGIGFVVGSLQGSRGGEASRLKRRYLEGLLLTGLGSLATGASFWLGVAVGAFALGGYGNGLAVVHQRLLFQSQVDSALQGRVFAISDALAGWGFALGFLCAGAMAAATTPRALMLMVGGGEVTLAAVTAVALRRRWASTPPTVSDESGLAVPDPN